MKALLGVLGWIARDFGPLLAFYGTNHWFGFKPAILVAMGWAVNDVSVVTLRGEKVTAFFWFSVTVTLVFGAVDLWLRGPVLLRYESVLTNLVTAAFFGLTLRGERTIIQEFAERQAAARGKPLNLTPDTLSYLRWCSIVWTGSFVVKAAA